MPSTQAKAIEAFKHILSNIFEAPDDGPLSKALEHAGYEDIWTLTTLRDEDIKALAFDWSQTEKNVPLGSAHQSLLHIFCHYCNHQEHTGDPIGDDWLPISADAFFDYHIGPGYRAICTGMTVIPPPVTTTPQPT